MYIDDIRLLMRNKKRIWYSDTNSQDIGMEFGFQKCAKLIMKNEKSK